MKLEMNKLLTNEWQKMECWWGNTELGFECWGKKIGGNYLYVWGKEDKHKEEYQVSDFMYSLVGEWSGMFKPNTSAEDLMKYVDFRHILSSGRNLTESEVKQFNIYKDNESGK